MVRRRTIPLLVLATLLCAALPARVHAADQNPGQGLLISPIRQYLSANAGKSIHSTFTVANLTNGTLDVTVAVKQFSVTNYSYSYTFRAPDNNWLHLSTNLVHLQAGQSSEVAYDLTIPAGSAPGGLYYTLMASATATTRGVASTIQAADLVYLTVNGKLTSVSHLVSSSIHWLSFGHDINFSLQPINTGNIYSFVYVSAQLHGPFTKPARTSTAHMLIPGKVRSLTGSISAPLLPGIYKATYGYKTESNWIIQQQHWVVFIPPWFIAFVLAALLLAGKFLPGLLRRRRSVPPQGKVD